MLKRLCYQPVAARLTLSHVAPSDALALPSTKDNAAGGPYPIAPRRRTEGVTCQMEMRPFAMYITDARGFFGFILFDFLDSIRCHIQHVCTLACA
jgi:hypothetical protein